jgi:PTH1 family peptidyl-tRNA hydrolase
VQALAGEAEWTLDKKLNALKATGEIGGKKVTYLLPETMMNNSGKSLATLVKTKKAAEQVIVIHDELDLPLGTLKLSWNRGTGGHRGLDSIVKQIKTKEFMRVRVGIAPATASGKTKKPSGEAAVLKHILGEFKPAELKTVMGWEKKIASALETIISESREKAMTLYNA